ncbi:MAG: class I SAM-dependent methyltransferase [Oscillospiraceae bacterium]|nr:class I SAM-dependent methyltransferase [Oscillospiraceae bacterium]
MPTKNRLSTAAICAFSRAYHSNVSKDRVFDDYLAYDLMGKEEYDELYSSIATDEPSTSAEFINNFITPITLGRIRFAESKLKAFAAEHGSCQYVICGAGYDTLSFRNTNPEIGIFEVDHPDMQTFKKKRIADLQWNVPRNVHFVAVDFEKDDFISTLLGSGFDPNKKTFFSILGVAYYLTLPVFAKTVSYISQVASPGSMLVFDYPDETLHHESSVSGIRKLAMMTEKLGEIMRGGYYVDDLCEALRSESFKLESHLAPSDIGECFFAGRQDGLKAMSHIYLVSAVKKEDAHYHL